jgi:hypothetical protein
VGADSTCTCADMYGEQEWGPAVCVSVAQGCMMACSAGGGVGGTQPTHHPLRNVPQTGCSLAVV